MQFTADQVWGLAVAADRINGGKVCYTVNLDQPTQFPWRSEPSTTVLIDCDEIIANLL